MRALYDGRDLGNLYPQLWLLRYVRNYEGNPESFALYLGDTAHYGTEEMERNRTRNALMYAPRFLIAAEKSLAKRGVSARTMKHMGNRRVVMNGKPP